MSDSNVKKDFNDINHIMLEMDNLTKEELAISEEKKLELIEKLDVSDYRQGGSCEPCCREVPFCCAVPIPKGFTVNIDPASLKLDTVSCLVCCKDTEDTCDVEANIPNCPTVTLQLCPVKAIGCIQYIITVKSVKGDCQYRGVTQGMVQCPQTPEDNRICCQGCVCIDQILSYSSDLNNEFCHKIPCEAIGVCLEDPVLEACDSNFPNGTQLVIFKGQFILPEDCVNPTCTPTQCPTPCPNGM